MLSLDLFDSRYEKRLHEGALDDTITRTQAHLMEPLSRRAADIRTQIRTGKLSGAELDKLEKEYEDLVQKRLDIMLDRQPKNEQQVPSKQDPFAYVKPEPKGIGDIQDPKQKMAQLAQRSKKGPLANVAAGIKAFVKGEPEPMGEEQQAINPRALGVANFQRLVKANMGAYPSVSLEFIRPEENFKLDQRGLDLISDYYDGLENDQAKNYFIYRVLPSGEETLKVLKQLGYSPVQAQQQQNLPGIPTQGELPLQEKKKSNNDDLEAGDIKVARELQKLRAEYPAARSDVEAVARAEIDSTERSQRQLAAIRGANEKQDALLKQLVALDQEQGREISGLDKENNSLEQRLAQVQATNDRLQQTIGKMTGTKKAATKATAVDVPPTGSADLAQGGIIDVSAPVASAPADQPKEKSMPTKSAMGSMAQQLGGFSKVVPMRSVRPTQPTTDTEPESQPAPSIRQQKVSGSDINEHGGGIGPKQHWQDLMQEGQPQELINRYLAINAETDVDAVRKAIQAISRDSTLSATSKSRLLGQIGMIIQRHRLPIGRSYYTFMQQYMEEQTVSETVENVRAGMAEIYRRLAPKIERHRDSFLAGQLYDELENYAELHGAEGEFKRMMSTARNRAHMEYDTNPGGFQNWFWFLPFEDEQLEEIDRRGFLKGLGAAAVAGGAGYVGGVRRVQNTTLARVLGKLNGFLKPLKASNVKDKWSYELITRTQDLIQKYKIDSDIYNNDLYAFGENQGERAYKMAFLNGIQTSQDREKYEAMLFELSADLMNATGFHSKYMSKESIEQDVAEGTDELKKKMSKLEALALAANRAGDDTKCKMYQQKIQSLKQKLSQSMSEGWSDQGNPTAYSVYIDGREWRAYKSDDHARAVAEKVRANLKRQGRDQTVTIAPSKTKKVNEGREIQTREDFIKERDRLLRMIGIETDPANKQILKSAIRQLENRAENEGWITIQSRMVREDSDGGEAVEMAIMRRMLVAHTDLIVEFGLDKVVQAIEEVAYNVGDTDEIGSSDVSGWVNQVKQILGVDA